MKELLKDIRNWNRDLEDYNLFIENKQLPSSNEFIKILEAKYLVNKY